MLVYIMSES